VTRTCCLLLALLVGCSDAGSAADGGPADGGTDAPATSRLLDPTATDDRSCGFGACSADEICVLRAGGSDLGTPGPDEACEAGPADCQDDGATPECYCGSVCQLEEAECSDASVDGGERAYSCDRQGAGICQIAQGGFKLSCGGI
jgi:hypothetical protein